MWHNETTVEMGHIAPKHDGGVDDDANDNDDVVELREWQRAEVVCMYLDQQYSAIKLVLMLAHLLAHLFFTSLFLWVLLDQFNPLHSYFVLSAQMKLLRDDFGDPPLNIDSVVTFPEVFDWASTVLLPAFNSDGSHSGSLAYRNDVVGRPLFVMQELLFGHN